MSSLIFNLSSHSSMLDQFMIFCAVDLIFIIYGLAVILAVFGSVKERKAILLTCLGLAFATLLIKIIRIFLIEPRPYITLQFQPLIGIQPGESFPSLHATLAGTIAWANLFYHSRLTYIVLPLALLVAIARVYVRVHYFQDIVAGLVIGFICVLLAWKLKNKLLRI